MRRFFSYCGPHFLQARFFDERPEYQLVVVLGTVALAKLPDGELFLRKAFERLRALKADGS